MSEIRELIREVLAEEIAALRSELLGVGKVEQVQVGTATELTDFAISIITRADADANFAKDLRAGRIRFDPVGATPPARRVDSPPPARTAPAGDAIPVVAAPPKKAELRAALITVRDIEAVSEGETRLRILKNARLTPLANDEARRRGIRIERTLA